MDTLLVMKPDTAACSNSDALSTRREDDCFARGICLHRVAYVCNLRVHAAAAVQLALYKRSAFQPPSGVKCLRAWHAARDCNSR